MRALAILSGILAPATVFAASGAGEVSSGILIWMFLGFCALVVVAQVIPALLMMFGIGKGIASVVKDELTSIKNK